MTRRVAQPYAGGRGPKALTIAEKLARSTERRDGCLIWTGCLDKDGYGKAWHEGRNVRAHVLAFIGAHGPVPPGLSVLHHCDVAACCDSEHIYAGTQLDNMRDRLRRGRWAGRRPRKAG